jgi:hypothetical protein
MPPSFLLMLAAILSMYVLTAEMVKRHFYTATRSSAKSI